MSEVEGGWLEMKLQNLDSLQKEVEYMGEKFIVAEDTTHMAVDAQGFIIPFHGKPYLELQNYRDSTPCWSTNVDGGRYPAVAMCDCGEHTKTLREV